jgi:hypothetical protein
MKPPTFFLSSTIYDFKDLRSALKFYLEEQGCTVLASEYNDFLKPLDAHSYEACLRALERADYYVLLIGSRVGGWYDPANRVSITQQEYRHAYELQKAGKLKILTFVRAEVWQLREERKELAAYLASLPYSDAEKKRIEAYPSKFSEDAEFINAFINEVGRNRETAAALESGGKLPTGNWIHEFHGFREVIATLQAQIFSGAPVAEATLRRLLQSEVREILRRCIPRKPKGMLSPRHYFEDFRKKYPINLTNRNEEFLFIPAGDWDSLTWFSYHLIAAQFHPMILDAAIVAPHFLRFDTDTSTFEETPFHNALTKLRSEIRRFNECNTSETVVVVYEHSPKNRLNRHDTIAVEPQKLAGLLHLYDRWTNIMDLCVAIYRHLDGKPFAEPSLRSRSPVEGMAEQIDSEFPTPEETVMFINWDFEAKAATTE